MDLSFKNITLFVEYTGTCDCLPRKSGILTIQSSSNNRNFEFTFEPLNFSVWVNKKIPKVHKLSETWEK